MSLSSDLQIIKMQSACDAVATAVAWSQLIALVSRSHQSAPISS
jgi:hypothetical protein